MPSPAHILVTLLLLLAIGLLATLFIVPTTSPWFWPLTAALVLTGLAAWLIPLRREDGGA